MQCHRLKAVDQRWLWPVEGWLSRRGASSRRLGRSTERDGPSTVLLMIAILGKIPNHGQPIRALRELSLPNKFMWLAGQEAATVAGLPRSGTLVDTPVSHQLRLPQRCRS